MSINNIKIKTRVSGALLGAQTSNNVYPYIERDGQLKVGFIYMGGFLDGYQLPTEKKSYEYLINSVKEQGNSFFINYSNDSAYALDADSGIAPYLKESAGNTYSIYKREYNKFSRPKYNSANQLYSIETKEYFGPWTVAAAKVSIANFRDFKVESGKTYQYIIYPSENEDNKLEQQFANKNTAIAEETRYGDPVSIKWNEWSIAELIPETVDPTTPIIKKSYKVNLDNIWVFKYGLETGSQTQNINRNETQTLGQFLKIGYGNANYISGEVSAFLGSEIVPMTSEGYVERLRKSINTPLSTNEKALMLSKWRSFVKSKNPKLLKDMKGQSWIVQIMSNSNTPRNFYHDQPDTISFSWKQIDSTDNVVIWSSGEKLPELGQCNSTWDPMFTIDGGYHYQNGIKLPNKK